MFHNFHDIKNSRAFVEIRNFYSDLKVNYNGEIYLFSCFAYLFFRIVGL